MTAYLSQYVSKIATTIFIHGRFLDLLKKRVRTEARLMLYMHEFVSLSLFIQTFISRATSYSFRKKGFYFSENARDIIHPPRGAKIHPVQRAQLKPYIEAMEG